MNKYLRPLLTALLPVAAYAQDEGAEVYANYCAACHGAEGAGLVGPNLTDAEVLHGESLESIRAVVTNGVPGRSMPAWSELLSETQIDQVSVFVKSIMGKNLPSPAQESFSTVTAFPEGSLEQPYVLRTFMPKLDLGDEVFANHYEGRPTPKYSPRSGTFSTDELDYPIDGIPGAIAVNFGNQLSYCFDITECRLLYTWRGSFMDMTNYWGDGTDGRRKRFGYIGELMGPVGYLAKGTAPIEGKPKFKGYEKQDGVPVFLYSLGDIDVSLKITPGQRPGVAVCQYKVLNTSDSLKFQLSSELLSQVSYDKGTLEGGVLELTPEEAADFTLTIEPRG